MGLVQRALRVFTLLFGSVQLLTETGQLFFQLGLAVLQLFDLLAKFRISRSRSSAPCWAAPERDTRSQPWPRRSPPWVMTESPSGRLPCNAFASERSLAACRCASRRRIATGPRTRAASEVGATFSSSSPLATSAR